MNQATQPLALDPQALLAELTQAVGARYTLTDSAKMERFTRGWRFGGGEALAVVRPGNLVEMWRALQACVKADVAIIVQAANTGLTGGSTPNGADYDRPIVIISTMRIDDIQLINDATQIVALPGSTLFGLEERLEKHGREPHSVIGSSCIGASIVGGVCNNSGGALVQRGPAYTELAIYAQIGADGQLELVNNLGIELGDEPEAMLKALDKQSYTQADIFDPGKLASDNEYAARVRDVDADTPARFNHDPRRLKEASGCAGKLAVFAVRVDTYEKPAQQKVFYVGTNDPAVLAQMRRDILGEFKNLPVSGEYIHRHVYDITKKYGKDSFFIIDKFGSKYIPKLFGMKAVVDRHADKISFLPKKLSDKFLQYFSYLLPNQLPKKMEQFRDRFEHHWMLEMSNEGVDEARAYLTEFFKTHEGDFFECTEEEGDKAILHRFVAAGAIGRYHIMEAKRMGPMMTIDVAFRRNEFEWMETLPAEVEAQVSDKFYYGHFLCHVMHQNYIMKPGVDAKACKQKILGNFDQRGAEYPAEHNVGHEYKAKPVLVEHYKSIDPTNAFNPGIGQTSKLKNWTE